MRSLRAFLYRRLARWITCEIALLGRHRLALDSKYQVNSLQDVFCHPFYWQVFGLFGAAPGLVVDLGAHCGHFSMLADLCLRVRFGEVAPRYVLVEPNPRLIRVIHLNLRRSGLCPRHTVYQGLVGSQRSGPGTLWVSPHNYLSASLRRGPGTTGLEALFIDLEVILKERRIDLLKVDIEGAEAELVEAYPELLRRVSVLMMEIHDGPEEQRDLLWARLRQAGLRPKCPPLRHQTALLAVFEGTGL